MRSPITSHTTRRYARQLVSGPATWALLLVEASNAAAASCASNTDVPIAGSTLTIPCTQGKERGSVTGSLSYEHHAKPGCFCSRGAVQMKHITHRARWSCLAPGQWLLDILVNLLLGSIPVCAPYARSATTVDFPGLLTLQDGKLTARIMGASLWHVMEEVTRLSGGQVQWMDSRVREQAVLVEFTVFPLSDAVWRLLGETNFLLVYAPRDEGTPLTQIWIASREKARGQPGRNRPPAALVPPPPTAEELAEAVEQPLDPLIQTATGDADPASRLAAIGDLGNYAQQDASVRGSLADLTNNDSDQQAQDAASPMLGVRP